MKQKLFIGIILLNLCYSTANANLNSLTWRGVYYPGISNKKNISNEYCRRHTIGTFIHSVKKALSQGVVTDRGVRLDHASFHEEKKSGVYLITGDLLAHGKTGKAKWTDHVHYYFYKLTEDGRTQGVWSTGECKGLYIGTIVNKKDNR